MLYFHSIASKLKLVFCLRNVDNSTTKSLIFILVVVPTCNLYSFSPCHDHTSKITINTESEVDTSTKSVEQLVPHVRLALHQFTAPRSPFVSLLHPVLSAVSALFRDLQ